MCNIFILLLLLLEVFVKSKLILSKENLIKVGDKNDLVFLIIFVVLFEDLVMFFIIEELLLFGLLNILFDLEKIVFSYI